VGRKFNETWSGAVTYAYDSPIGGYMLNLGPVDGYNSIALSATYTRGPLEVTGVIRYFALGDTQTAIGPVAPATNFDGNDAVGIGLRVGYSF
jgi:hypothetical protein